jgi:hypothetical protein
MNARVRVGIAIGAGALTAVELRRSWRGVRPGRTWTWPLTAVTGQDGQSALTAAFDALRDVLDAASVSASIALLRPLAQAKVITTPPIGRHALELLVERNVQRYFIAGAEPAIVAAAPVPSRRGATEPSRTAAVCAPRSTVAAVTAAAAAAGFVVDRLTAAPVALAAAIRALAPAARRGRVLAVVAGTGVAEALLLDDDRLRLVLPLSHAGLTDADSMARMVSRLVLDGAECGCRPTHAIVLSDGAPLTGGTRESLSGAEGEVLALSAPSTLTRLGADALAAFGAALADGRTPQLLTEELRGDRRRRSVRRTISLYAAAAAMMALGGAGQLWSTTRELREVEARRRALAPSLVPAMRARRSVESARITLEALARLERESPRWTQLFAELARALPDSAYLMSLSTSGATVRLTGVASSAHAIVAPLQASPAFADVALSGAARREARDGRDQFELSATVGPASTLAPLVRPARRNQP